MGGGGAGGRWRHKDVWIYVILCATLRTVVPAATARTSCSRAAKDNPPGSVGGVPRAQTLGHWPRGVIAAASAPLLGLDPAVDVGRRLRVVVAVVRAVHHAEPRCPRRRGAWSGRERGLSRCVVTQVFRWRPIYDVVHDGHRSCLTIGYGGK